MPFLRIGVDSREAVRGFRDYERAADRAKRGTREFDDRLRQTEGSFKRLSAASIALKGAVLGIATGALAVTARRMFELGTAVEETGSKFRTVFGGQAGSVNAFLDEFANKAGLTNQQGQELAATAGAIAQGMGFAGQEAAGFAEQILRVSGDLASFNNRDIEQAFAAVRSGITGEREALKTLGIVLSETDVQKRALADSGKALASQLTAEDRAAANLALIMERAGVAIGDLDRTQNSAANTARRVAARFRELEQALATALLPLFDALLRSLDRSTDGFATLAREIRAMATDVAVAAIELQKLDNFVRVITLERSFAEGKQAARELEREIQRLRATATGVYDEAEANADVIALAFGIGADEARQLADEWNAIGANVARSADEAERMADAVKRIGVVTIGSPTVIGPDGFPVPSTGDLAGTRRFGRNQGPFVTSPALGDFSDRSFEGLRRAIEGFDEADAQAASMADTLFASIPGIVSLADGVLDLDGNARSALRGIGDLAGGLSRIGQGSFLGNLPGILGIAGGAVNLLSGALGGLFGGDDDEQRAEELRQLSQETNRLIDGFARLARELDKSISARSLAVSGLDDSEIARQRFLLGQTSELSGTRGGINELLAELDGGRFGGQLTGDADQARTLLDNLLSQQAAGSLFVPQEALDALREYIALIELQGLELDAFNRAQEEAIARERERIDALRLSFEQDLDIREADLGGDDLAALQTRLEVERDREIASARALLEAGDITQDLFDRLANVLDGELNQALDAFNERLENQARALERASAALAEDLEVRALLATGQREEADLLRLQIDQQRELNRAIEEGIAQDVIDKLRDVQGLELDALLNQQTRGGELLGRAPTNTPDTVSVTSIQEVTATNILFINRQQLAELQEVNSHLRAMRFGNGLTASQALGQEFAQARRLSGNPIRQAA